MRNLSFALTFALAFATGCLTPTTPDGETSTSEENLGEVESEIGGCCSYGVFYCPSTGESYDYSTPRCGEGTRPNVQSACRRACGNVSCVDSGWSGPFCE